MPGLAARSAAPPARLDVLAVSLVAPRPRDPTLGTMVHQRARALARAGHRVRLLAPVRVFPDTRLLRSLLSPPHWPALPGNLREWTHRWLGASGQRHEDGVRYLYRRFASLPGVSRSGDNAESFLRTQRGWLERSFAGTSCDIVVGHFLETAPLVDRLARLAGARAALFVHEDLESVAQAIGEPRVRRRLAAIPLLLTHGARTERQIRQRLACPRPVHILPPPLDPCFLGEPAPARLDPTAAFRLVLVGRFFAPKNQRLLVEAADRWRALGRKPPLRVVLAGDHGEGRRGLEREIRRRRLRSEVTVSTIDGAAGVAAALRRAHAAVLPSRVESFSMAALEAAALGVPLLTGSQVGFRDELARRGVTPPPSFDVESAEALVGALDELIAGYGERRRQALELRAYVVREFTEERFSAGFAAILP